MDSSCLVSVVQAGGGDVMVRRIFSWHIFNLLVPIEQDYVAYHNRKIILNQFLDHDSESTVLKWLQQSPDLNLAEHFWDVVEQDIFAFAKRIKAALKAQAIKPSSSKVYLMTWPVQI